MTQDEYAALMTDVFDGLEEYESKFADAYIREYIALHIWDLGVPDLGDRQRNYEYLRDRVESFAVRYIPRPPGMLDWKPSEEE
jgi:hypothetical protein